jgi:polyisoprenoid-binding protein YceI
MRISRDTSTSTLQLRGEVSRASPRFSVFRLGVDFMRKILASLVAMLLVVSNGIAADKYALTGENTKIEFTGTKKEGKHTGGFKTLTGTITVDGDLTHTQIEVNIETDSLFSDDEKLTAHLKGADFFDVKNNPKATFVSTKLEKKDFGLLVHGKLTLNGKTKEIHFPAKIEVKENVLSLSSEFAIDRTDYGITYGAGKIDKNVTLKVTVAAKK